MPSRRRIYLSGLVLGALLWSSGSQATTILRQNLGELVDQAPLIFVGSAADQEVVLLPAADSPTTLVTFDVEEVLKGTTEDTKLTLAFEGGEWGGEVFEVVGMPTFETGGRYLLFLRNNGLHGGCPVAGWWQGKLSFVRHPLTGEDILVDHRGQPIQGIEGDDWLKADVRLDEQGLLRPFAEPGVVVESEEGIVITGLDDREATARTDLASVPSSRQVLTSLHHLVDARRGLASFRPGEDLASAGGQASLAAPPASLRAQLPVDHGERVGGKEVQR